MAILDTLSIPYQYYIDTTINLNNKSKPNSLDELVENLNDDELEELVENLNDDELEELVSIEQIHNWKKDFLNN